MNDQVVASDASASEPVAVQPAAEVNATVKQVAPAPVAPTAKVTDWLKSTQGIFAGILAILVVLPSIINAGLDIYVTLFNIPRTIAEQYNQELFQEHFQKQPIHTGSTVIKTAEGAELTIKLSVYDDGDIYVEYGNYSQWFPFKSSDNSAALLDWLMSPAYAETIVLGQAEQAEPQRRMSPCEFEERNHNQSAEHQVGSFAPLHYYTQKDAQQNKREFRRERIYDDGCKEILRIDINSGRIIDRELQRTELPADEKQAMRKKAVQLFAPQVIDIREMKRTPVLELPDENAPREREHAAPEPAADTHEPPKVFVFPQAPENSNATPAPDSDDDGDGN